MKKTEIQDIAIQLSAEVMTWLLEREEKLLMEHGYEADLVEMVALRLTLIDVLAVTSFSALAQVSGAGAEQALQMHSKHVRDGIKIAAKWKGARP